MTPRYFIWRLTNREPWRVYGGHRPLPVGSKAGEHRDAGEDIHDALEECAKANTERKGVR